VVLLLESLHQPLKFLLRFLFDPLKKLLRSKYLGDYLAIFQFFSNFFLNANELQGIGFSACCILSVTKEQCLVLQL
jgi:hypothetical protein